jgi:hypothetical protein
MQIFFILFLPLKTIAVPICSNRFRIGHTFPVSGRIFTPFLSNKNIVGSQNGEAIAQWDMT